MNRNKIEINSKVYIHSSEAAKLLGISRPHLRSLLPKSSEAILAGGAWYIEETAITRFKRGILEKKVHKEIKTRVIAQVENRYFLSKQKKGKRMVGEEVRTKKS